MKARALFVDYDGTIAPLGVPRAESRVIGRVARELRRIVRETPVCVVTAKDFDFIHGRCRFATGWACAAGLDIRLADGRSLRPPRLRNLDGALEIAKSARRRGTLTELKLGPAGELLGVTIDWSHAPGSEAYVAGELRLLRRKGYPVVYDTKSAFADVFAAPLHKGKALRGTKKLLEKSDARFIGDSVPDDSAFPGG